MKLTNVLAGLKLRVLLAGQDTEGMGTEVVTLHRSSTIYQDQEKKGLYLCLQDVSRNNFAPVAIEECQSRAESRSGNTPKDCLSDHTPPTRLSLVDGFFFLRISDAGMTMAVRVSYLG